MSSSGIIHIAGHAPCAILDGALVFGVESASDKLCCVGFVIGVDSATQYEFAVAHSIERVGRRHVAFPVGTGTARNLGPRAAVECLAVEVVLPYEAILVGCGCKRRHAERQCDKGSQDFHLFK